MGHRNSENKDLHQHQIYIHEKGQFWPNVNLPGIYKIKQPQNTETQLFIQAVKYEKISNYSKFYSIIFSSNVD